MGIRNTESRAIFRQLFDESQPGVKCVIENHDAWVNSSEVQKQIDAATRERLAREPRMAATAQRIREQRDQLSRLVITLPSRDKLTA
jgi:hypothetical protein